MESFSKAIGCNVLIFNDLNFKHGFSKIYLKYNVL